MNRRSLVLLLSLLVAVGGFLFWRYFLPVDDGLVVEPPQPDDNPEPVELISQIPILMYHVIGDSEGSLRELYVNPATFAAQMEYLHSNGYSTITMAELHEHWKKGVALPPRPIVLTFDDGYRCVYDEAFPVMQEFGFRGVLYLYVNKFDHANSLTNEEVAELVAAGFEVGNHTYTHIDLTTANEQRLVRETQAAKDALEQMFDVNIVSYAYPAGRFNAEVVKAVEDSGHQIAVTTRFGYGRPEQGLFTLSRVRINRSDGLQGFINKLKQYETEGPLR